MMYRSKSLYSIAALISGIGMAAWSPASHACAVEPYVSSVCTMAFSPTRYPSFSSTYILAMGQAMQVNQYAALFSLLGTTYGGNGSSTFNLPDLRGKVIVGYAPGNQTYAPGATGGSTNVQLNVSQLPQHSLPIVNVPVSLTNVSANTSLTGLSATANLSGVVITGAASGLTIKASSTSGGQNSPSGNYLGKPPSAAGNLYSNATPDATLNSGSIAGNLSLTVNQGVTAPVAVTGSASTTVAGNGLANGVTGVIGSNAPISVMQPYLVLPYYIAYNGVYPSSD